MEYEFVLLDLFGLKPLDVDAMTPAQFDRWCQYADRRIAELEAAQRAR